MPDAKPHETRYIGDNLLTPDEAFDTLQWRRQRIQERLEEVG